mgnify:CR=1 FL=1
MKTLTVPEALAEPNREMRRDMLGDLIVDTRSGRQVLSAEDAELLFTAQNEEAQRDDFDGAMYAKLWELLSFGPPHELTRRVAAVIIDNPRSLCRGAAARYLLRNYPQGRAELLDRLSRDPDPGVLDVVARELAATDRAAAIAVWERALGCDPLPHELAETIPHCLAGLAAPHDLARYAAWDGNTGKTIWGFVVAIARKPSTA